MRYLTSIAFLTLFSLSIMGATAAGSPRILPSVTPSLVPIHDTLSPVLVQAQECLTPRDVLRKAAERGITVLGRFSDVTTPSGIHIDHFIVFEVGDHWDLVGFDKDDAGRLCFVGYQSVGEDDLDGFLASVQRKAGPTT